MFAQQEVSKTWSAAGHRTLGTRYYPELEVVRAYTNQQDSHSPAQNFTAQPSRPLPVQRIGMHREREEGEEETKRSDREIGTGLDGGCWRSRRARADDKGPAFSMEQLDTDLRSAIDGPK
jgi:hypothetical protein